MTSHIEAARAELTQARSRRDALGRAWAAATTASDNLPVSRILEYQARRLVRLIEAEMQRCDVSEAEWAKRVLELQGGES